MASSPPNVFSDATDPLVEPKPDTLTEPRFDRLARLAQLSLDMPIAYVALDGPKQNLLGHCGPNRAALDGIERSQTFCQYTIAADEPVVVADTLEDERFAQLPLVTQGPRIRFYAGYPVRNPDGKPIGTVCTADTKPRDSRAVRLDLMSEVAALAEREVMLTDLVDAQEQALRTRQLMAEQVSEARRYVTGLLPRPAKLDGIEVDWYFEPHDELGGDIFNYGVGKIDGRESWFGYVIDVMGHGVGSSLHAAALRHALDEQLRTHQPGQALSNLSRMFPMTSAGGRFFTAFCCTFDPLTRQLFYAGAGHPPAVLVETNGQPTGLRSQSAPGGLDPRGIPTSCIHVNPGARLWMYSDAALELRVGDADDPDPDARHNILGADALLELMITASAESEFPNVADQLHGMLRQLEARPTDDDLTLLTARFG
ncbi:MAG: GAF domain-containing SpoIIE family protein phosphatase [Planctomycetota bacterium]